MKNEEQNIKKQKGNGVLPCVSGSASDELNKEQEIDYWQHLKNQCGGKRPNGIVRGYMRTWNYEDRK